MDINSVRYIGYVMPIAHGPCFVVRSSLRLFLGLKSAHTDRLFILISSEKISERFLIGAKVNAHEQIFSATLVDGYDCLDYETHATYKTMRYL